MQYTRPTTARKRTIPQIVDRSSRPEPRPAPERSRPLLIVSDGEWLQVYGQGVDVHVACMPHLPRDLPTEAAIRGEIMAQEAVERSLPPRYRQLYWPGGNLMLYQGQIERLTAHDLMLRDAARQAADKLRRARL